ncbi:MAG TPA: glycine cleavage T C-terminal barrel domain-containing protein, partial [Gemmataceae bacterium]|nr:glycine cleavage T C-terminal barrel domain-containing protein [Gemmataceae bacterium]
VCLCEDVTEKDLARAVAEGFDHVETLKRYTTVGMGPCQGKVCGAKASELCARLTGRSVAAVGLTTARPPAVPVELAVLAAERRHHPVRRTPMHHWHDGHGARWIDAGQWKRPESYGDPAAEVRAVRGAAGLIDVSTLGKIEVIGPDAAELLERVYINQWADLAAGRARYGVMCTEEGIVYDDGVGARVGPEHFYLTATTGNADGVFGWLELWRVTWRLNAVVLNRTSAFAAMNLAGPGSREILAGLTALDLSPDGFAYLAARQGEVAGVPCRLLRIGFVGELGYEIHCPSAYGPYLWEAILAAGSGRGLKPFGVEAQRILRLEKGHFIVGQDTDALSSPPGAGLGRMVRFAKPQFHGRAALLRLQELGLKSRLAGFTIPEGAAPPADGDWARRLEGCQVVEGGRSVGRVTSARYSPTLEKYVGLAWVPESRSAPGSPVSLRNDGRDLAAVVAPLPFYDPEGKRLRS